MDKRLKETLEQVTLPAGAKERILARCGEALDQPERPQKRSCWPKQAIAVAAVLSILSVTALAVGVGVEVVRLFSNPTIVENTEALDDAVSGLSVYGVSGPNSRTPHTLEEMVESRTQKSDTWLTEENIGGTALPDYTEWVSMEVLNGDGPLKSRRIYEDSGAVKNEYTMENPALRKEVETEFIQVDMTWLNEAYQSVPYGNLFYTMENPGGQYLAEHFSVLYATDDESAWFTWSYDYFGQPHGMNENTFAVASNYDVIYSYLAADGLEYVIKAYGDCIWAECTTPHSYLSLYGGYLTTDQVEEILDHLYVSMAEL